jgi:hypothetical protein
VEKARAYWRDVHTCGRTCSQPSSRSKRRATLTSAKSQKTKKTKNDAGDGRTYWTDAHFSFILKCLHKVKAQGGMPEGGFKKTTWQKILKSLKKKYPELQARKGFEWSKPRNRYDSVKRTYLIFKKHQQHVSGWAIQDELPVNEPEILREHAAAYPECKKWIETVPPFFVEMDVLLEGRTATGRHARLPGEARENQSTDDASSDDETDLFSSSPSEGSAVSDDDAGGSEDEAEVAATPSRSTLPAELALRTKEQKKLTLLRQATANTSSARGAAKIANAVNNSTIGFREALKEAAVIMASYERQQTTTPVAVNIVDTAMDIVSEMEDLSMQDRTYIMELFSEHQARIFLRMKTEERRREWIQIKLDMRQEFGTL